MRTDDVDAAAVNGAMTDQDLTLASAAGTATVTTQHTQSNNEDGTVSETYSLAFQVKEGNKLPVSVRLMSGPHVLHPVDLGKCMECGNNQFRYDVGTYGDRPAVGDSYDLLVNYSDDTSETLTAKVTGVHGCICHRSVTFSQQRYEPDAHIRVDRSGEPRQLPVSVLPERQPGAHDLADPGQQLEFEWIHQRDHFDHVGNRSHRAGATHPP